MMAVKRGGDGVSPLHTRGFMLVIIASLLVECAVTSVAAQQTGVRWADSLRQKADWYGSPEAIRVADNLLLYQRTIGGWQKNIDMARPLSVGEVAEIVDQKEQNDSTIDNGATHTQMIYLARVFGATGEARFREGFLRGLDYLLKAQYPNGGWPQYYPRLTGYYKHITYNDSAMIGVLTLLRQVARVDGGYRFVDESRRRKAARAVEKGIECILRTQVKVAGRLTVWCAQHDENSLAPAPARAYEKISLSGSESVGIVRFLMGIKNPDKTVVRSIESAIAWLNEVKLTGIRLIEKSDLSLPKGHDRVIVSDDKAPPLWARFYEIGTNRPIFCGRDGVIRYSLAEIEYERRNGYGWYTEAPADLLDRDYTTWRKAR